MSFHQMTPLPRISAARQFEISNRPTARISRPQTMNMKKDMPGTSAINDGVSSLKAPLLRAHALTDEQCGIRSGARAELFRAAVIDLGQI